MILTSGSLTVPELPSVGELDDSQRWDGSPANAHTRSNAQNYQNSAIRTKGLRKRVYLVINALTIAIC